MFTLHCQEPMLNKGNGHILTETQFGKKCHILTCTKYIPIKRGADGLPVMQRKFVVLFGLNEETGTWKYYLRIYRRTKKEAIAAAYRAVSHHAFGMKSPLQVVDKNDEFLEAFVVNYDRRVPITF